METTATQTHKLLIARLNPKEKRRYYYKNTVKQIKVFLGIIPFDFRENMWRAAKKVINEKGNSPSMKFYMNDKMIKRYVRLLSFDIYKIVNTMETRNYCMFNGYDIVPMNELKTGCFLFM